MAPILHYEFLFAIYHIGLCQCRIQLEIAPQNLNAELPNIVFGFVRFVVWYVVCVRCKLLTCIVSVLY